jgi:hypothetical protein
VLQMESADMSEIRSAAAVDPDEIMSIADVVRTPP